jgi:hypothetical protein
VSRRRRLLLAGLGALIVLGCEGAPVPTYDRRLDGRGERQDAYVRRECPKRPKNEPLMHCLERSWLIE